MIWLLACLALAEPTDAPATPTPTTQPGPAPAPALPADAPAEVPAAGDATEAASQDEPPAAVEAGVPPDVDAPNVAPNAPVVAAPRPAEHDERPRDEAGHPVPVPEATAPFPSFGPPWTPRADGHDEHADGHDTHADDEHAEDHDEHAEDHEPDGHDEPDAHDEEEDAGAAPPGEAAPPPEGTDDASTGAPADAVGPAALLLAPPSQSPGRTLLFLGVMALSTVASTVARRTRQQLRPGAISSLLRVADTAGRVLLVVAGIGLITQLLPRPLLPALPWAVLAAALAVGWSLRDALPDLVAWTQVSAEGSVRQGQWIRGQGFAGRVERIGLRATWLADDRGQRVAVPNRLLVGSTVRTDKERWYVTEVELELPDVDPSAARRAIERACMLSPWVAPSAYVDVRWDPVAPSRWSLRVQLLEGGFADPFRGALRERVEELLRLP